MTSPSDFPICPDCGQKHEPLPENITLSTHDLFHIQHTLHQLLAFSQEKRIPLTVISGMLQTFHAEIMEELMMRKREIMLAAQREELTPFVKDLEEFLKGGTQDGGFQKETGRTESKTSSSSSAGSGPSKGTDSTGTNKGGSGSGVLH